MRLSAIFAVAFTATSALAAGVPENALVVVNADSWASTWVANEYVAARRIPASNIVLLRDLPSFERINVADFREKILLPVLQAAEQRGLAPQLDYVLYSADLPWAIDVSADMAGKTFPQVITQPAAINGLTFFYQFALRKDPSYLGMNANFYFRQISRIAPEAPWPEAEQRRYLEALQVLQQISARREKARLEREKIEAEAKKTGAPVPLPVTDPAFAEEEKRLQPVRDSMLALRAAHPKSTELLYNLACVHAQLGEAAPALAALGAAMDHGWWDMRHAERDPDFRSLRDRPEFKELAARAKTVKFELTPTSGFRGNVGWAPNGAPVPAAQGLRFLLSMMLACTSGRGTSAREAVAGLRRSVAADGTRPGGTIYFLENGDVRSTTREWGFARTAEKLRELGVGAAIETGVLPQKKPDVAGLTAGAADFDWSQSGSTILPGAICEHLTSFGGVMTEGAGQTPLSVFLAAGAAGASGTVTEPYAIQAKFPSPFIHWHYAQGCTLAEAFYQSVAAPYQLLIVGDALCTPWKKRFAISADGLAPGALLSGPLRVTPKTTSADGLKPGLFELYLDGRRIAAAKPEAALEFNTTSVADGAHLLTLVAGASDAMATPARLEVPVSIRNHTEKISVTAPPAEWPWDRPLQLEATAPGATAIIIRQHGREVARVTGEKGRASLDPRVLGAGPVTLETVASFANGREARATPVTTTIVPPAALPAQTPPTKLAAGFHVIASGAAPMLAAKADGDWLEKAGVPKDGGFAIEAWFRVEKDDVYQFQLHGPEKLRVFVDGKPQDWPRGKEWWFVPVPLQKGAHRLRIEATANGAPKLDVRFGGPGSYKLDGARFQHAE